MDPITRYEHPPDSGVYVEIHYDDAPGHANPRECDGNLTTLACEHQNYSLGDGSLHDAIDRSPDEFRSFAHLERYLRLCHGAIEVAPLGLIDHSGISMYVGGGAHPHDPGGWDSGAVA